MKNWKNQKNMKNRKIWINKKNRKNLKNRKTEKITKQKNHIQGSRDPRSAVLPPMVWVPRVSGPPSDGMGAQGERPFFSGMGLGDP